MEHSHHNLPYQDRIFREGILSLLLDAALPEAVQVYQGCTTAAGPLVAEEKALQLRGWVEPKAGGALRVGHAKAGPVTHVHVQLSQRRLLRPLLLMVEGLATPLAGGDLLPLPVEALDAPSGRHLSLSLSLPTRE